MNCITHITTSLGSGGAERVVFDISKAQVNRGLTVNVLCLTGQEFYVDKLKKFGINTRIFYLPGLSAIYSLIRHIFSIRESFVYAHMYHSMLVSCLFAKRSSIVWIFHHAAPTSKSISRSTAVVIKFCSLLSKFMRPDAVFLNTHSYDSHIRYGFRFSNAKLIRNGVDVDYFKPSHDAMIERLRSIGERPLVIGYVARWNPIKNHTLFLDICSDLVHRGVDITVVLSGESIDFNNTSLTDLIDKRGLTDHVELLGQCVDMNSIYNRLDIHCTTSCAEGFGLASAEAMACGVFCLSTDVGSQRELLSRFGLVCQDDLASSFVEGILGYLAMSFSCREDLALGSRKHIVERFSTQVAVDKYHSFISR